MVNPRGNIFTEHADGLKQQCSNTIIRNVLPSSKISLVIFIWSYLFFYCIYSRLFWKDLEFYINRKIVCMIEICIFDVLFYTENENLNRKEQHILHLFILLGKFHIHKNKWAQCKPNFAHFINDFKLYVNLLKKKTTTLKTCNALKALECI